MLSATQQLVELAVKQPGLKLLQLLLGSHALTTAAAIVSTSYWATPQVRQHHCSGHSSDCLVGDVSFVKLLHCAV
jgi:hypothetical protein